MSKDHLTAKERENRKVIIILHAGLTTTLNGLEEKDYPYIYTKTANTSLSSLLHSHHKFIEQFQEMFKDTERKLTIFDKALCLAMAMQRNPVIYTSNLKGKIPQRLCDLNEKTIVETILFYVTHSTYHIKRTDVQGELDLATFNNNHKRELKALKTMLIEEFKKTNFDYNKCIEVLKEICLRIVCYENGIDIQETPRLRNKTTIKEKSSAPSISIKTENTYSNYKKKAKK